MAALRAVTMARRMKKTVLQAGQPRAASMAPMKAKGRARTLWPILTMSRISQILRQNCFMGRL